MSSYLFAVQDQTGREITSWTGDVERVSDVFATQLDKDHVVIGLDGEGVSEPGFVPADAGKLTLYRWPADDKMSKPVAHPVSWEQEA